MNYINTPSYYRLESVVGDTKKKIEGRKEFSFISENQQRNCPHELANL